MVNVKPGPNPPPNARTKKTPLLFMQPPCGLMQPRHAVGASGPKGGLFSSCKSYFWQTINQFCFFSSVLKDASYEIIVFTTIFSKLSKNILLPCAFAPQLRKSKKVHSLRHRCCELSARIVIFWHCVQPSQGLWAPWSPLSAKIVSLQYTVAHSSTQ